MQSEAASAAAGLAVAPVVCLPVIFLAVMTAAVVIDDGGGIGSACARRFARHGVDVVTVGMPASPLEDTCTAIRREGGSALAIVADPGDEDAIAAAALRCEDLGLQVAALVNCHMHLDWGTVEGSSLLSWRRALEYNILGPLTSSRAFLPLLRRARGAAIVHVGSVDGTFGNPIAASYSVSKAGLVPLTHIMADEFAPYAIRVNCVARAAVLDKSGATSLPANLLAETPLRRAASPDEIASVVWFLASDEASYVTGAVLPADGGRTAITAGTRTMHLPPPREGA